LYTVECQTTHLEYWPPLKLLCGEHSLCATMSQNFLNATRLVLVGKELQIQLRNLPAPLKIVTNSKSKRVWGTKTCEQQGTFA